MTDDLVKLKTLYPNLGDEYLVVVKENLDRYLSLAWEIAEDARLQSNNGSCSLAESSSRGTIQGKVDSQQTNHLPNP
jgi:hypothetical protein